MSVNDIALLNPNTFTLTNIRTRTDAELLAKIYKSTPVFINETTNSNPWSARFMQGLFNMTSESSLFSTSSDSKKLPLYEAKMLHQFDHRWATYEGDHSRDLTNDEKKSPDFSITPRYWVNKTEVDRVVEFWDRNWFLAFRDITRPTELRTALFSIIPRYAVGNNAPLIFTGIQDASKISCLVANFNSLVLDYVARQKVSGTHLNFFIAKQLPLLPPSTYSSSHIRYIAPAVLELVYTAYDLRPFAIDMDYHGEPFRWDEDRRAQLRAELDAYYARLYGLNRKQLRYILDPHGLSEQELENILDPWEDPTCSGPHLLPAKPALDFPGETFRVLKEKEEKQFGEYRTRRLVLEAWDKMSQG